jgi:hypothetical protein
MCLILKLFLILNKLMVKLGHDKNLKINNDKKNHKLGHDKLLVMSSMESNFVIFLKRNHKKKINNDIY